MDKENRNNFRKGKETMEPKNINPLNHANIFSDVLGSYTGIAEDGEKPIQDADDL